MADPFGSTKLKRTPLDIYFRRQSQPKGIDEESVSPLERILTGINRVALALGFGRFVSAYQITLTTTNALIRQHTGGDDILIKIFNNDIVAAKTAFLNPGPGSGFPLAAGDQLQFILSEGDKVFGNSSSGTIEIRIAEFGTHRL